MLPREFRRRLEADAARREDEADYLLDLTLVVTNHIRMLANKPMAAGQKPGRLRPLTMKQMKRQAPDPSEAGTREAFEALCRRIGIPPPSPRAIRAEA